jgi:hypothetical protein
MEHVHDGGTRRAWGYIAGIWMWRDLEKKQIWWAATRGLYCPPVIPAGFLRIPEDSWGFPGLNIG